MNEGRRRDIARANVLVRFAGAWATEARELIERLQAEEQAYLDAMPEGPASEGPGDKARAAITGLAVARSHLQLCDLPAVIRNLEEAAK